MPVTGILPRTVVKLRHACHMTTILMSMHWHQYCIYMQYICVASTKKMPSPHPCPTVRIHKLEWLAGTLPDHKLYSIQICKTLRFSCSKIAVMRHVLRWPWWLYDSVSIPPSKLAWIMCLLYFSWCENSQKAQRLRQNENKLSAHDLALLDGSPCSNGTTLHRSQQMLRRAETCSKQHNFSPAGISWSISKLHTCSHESSDAVVQLRIYFDSLCTD